MIRIAGRWFLGLYCAFVRLRCKCFSLLISGAFERFGSSTVVMTPVRLSGAERIAIGNSVFVGPGSWLQTLSGGAVSIGDGTSIAGACVISAARSVVLEDRVLLARNVYISDHIHRYVEVGTPILAQGIDKVAPVLIKRGAWLGQNVVVCPGVTIGAGAVVGANAVVTQDVPDYSVAVGAPARTVKRFESVPQYT